MTRTAARAAALLVCLVACAAAAARATASLGRFGARGPVTVSGISAGAFMAVQVHVAFSATVAGAGVVAGGPFWCAQDDAAVALTSCMTKPALISITELVAVTDATQLSLTIDPVDNLKSSRVYMYSGSKDSVVEPGVVLKLQEYYEHYMGSGTDQIMSVFDVPSEHAFITSDFGSACDYFGEPYINNCGYDQAGVILQHLAGHTQLAPRGQLVDANLFDFDQREFAPQGVLVSSMSDTGFVYVPTACQKSGAQCSVHVALHGCLMGFEKAGDQFVRHAGYNEWAESNGIIVLYPQISITPQNPKGCFDWWGYTGADYASKLGQQMIAIKAMISRVSSS